MKILIVEDEPSLREVMTQYLEKERYTVETAATFRDASAKVAMYSYDCILLDMMLPDGSGLALLRDLKDAHKKENVIIISAKDSVDDKIEGLETGADDYLAKPFHLSELGARIRSLVRRSMNQGENIVELGNVRLYPDRYVVYVDDKLLELNRKEYDILHYFIIRPDRLVEKATLAEAVWGDYIDQVDSFDFIYAQIKNLRRRMHDAGANLEIKAVYGFGYKITVT